MSKVAVVYWSGTGNTQIMAESVANGVKEAGGVADMFQAAEFDSGLIDKYDAIAFGCPAMGAEELEDSEFGPMFAECESGLSGKKILLFGSYGWGDGEWMRTWEDMCRGDGAVIVSESVICCETPDDDAIAACVNAGKSIGA